MTQRRTLSVPEPDALRALGERLGFHLSDSDVEAYRALMMGSIGSFQQLDEVPDAIPAPAAGRRWWEPEANPLGAWHACCEIRTREDGPLAGMRLVAKDNVMVAGLPLMNGSTILEGYVAEIDATVVTRLLEAGAVLTGKAHCEDLCLSGGSFTNARGPVHNPRRHGYSSGGSSSGSAALVASGEVELAIGGDQGGSIRIPAALCGVVGMKPTWGLVPYTGIAPIEPSLDHTGPITANVRDNARMLAVMAGPDGIDMRQSGQPAGDYLGGLEHGVAGLRVGLLREGFAAPGMQDEVAAAVVRAGARLEALGARVEECSVPEHLEAGTLTLPLLAQGMFRTVLTGEGMGTGRPDIYPPEFGARMARWREHADAMSPLAKLLTLAGAHIEAEAGTRYYAAAANQARRVRAAFDRALASFDALLLPTCPGVASPLPRPDASILERFALAAEASPNTQPFDATHHPAISVPCGDAEGLPIGAMLVGRHFDEATLYRIAFALEQDLASG